MHPDARPWIESSDYDLASAEAMLREGQFLHVPFFCQQALEKRLKALIVERKEVMPPKVHSLVALAEEAEVELSKELRELLDDLSSLYVTTRYPEVRLARQESDSEAAAKEYVRCTKEVVEWLDQLMRR